LKLGLSHLAYIPATTRATMSRLGASTTFEIDGEVYAMSPHEMPGEVEWRADYLRWMVRRFVHYLARRPRAEWGKVMVEIEEEAVCKHMLLNVESRAFAEGVLLSLEELMSSDIERLARNAELHDAELKAAGEALSVRFTEMAVQYGQRLELGHGVTNAFQLMSAP
jgi:hypothetical protein